MLNYLKFHFRGRKAPLLFAADDDSFERCRRIAQDRKIDRSGFCQFGTILGHDIWLNLARVQLINFLEEPITLLPFDPQSVGPSKHWLTGEESEPDYREIWEAKFAITGLDQSYDVYDLRGHDWVTIRTTLDMGEGRFILIEDEDGEEVAISSPDVDFVIGTEIERYSDAQRSTVDEVIKF